MSDYLCFRAKRVEDMYKERIKLVYRDGGNKSLLVTKWNPTIKLAITVTSEDISSFKFLTVSSGFKEFTGIVTLDSNSNRCDSYS